MEVVLDSENVFKGVTEWSIKWHWHGWWVKSIPAYLPTVLHITHIMHN